MHPEILAYLEVEQRVRRRRVVVQALAVAPSVLVGLVLRAMTYAVVNHRIEAHLGAAFELVALAAPSIGAIALARAWFKRWARSPGALRLAARVAARHGVTATAVHDALLAR